VDDRPAHSEIQFKVKHLMITTVTGYFTRFNLEVKTVVEYFTRSSHILFTADIDSINTNSSRYDTHLKSADFFNAAHFQLNFIGWKFEKAGHNYLLHGDLTIRTTSPVTVTVD
jgi:polyisoprenoid-binding protein YceI